MKRVVIVHCWSGFPEYCWYPNTKKELEDKGFEVKVPEMPDTHLPKLSSWLPKLSQIAGVPNEDLFLVGHSLGCITILRYLEKLKDGEKVGGVVFVAGFTDDLSSTDPIEDELSNFFETPILWDKIRISANKFAAIYSDNDPYVSLKYSNIFKEKLNAEIIIKNNMGHFSGELGNPESTTLLSVVAEEILNMAEK